ncbi:MAG TPA: hypothetical protein PLO56_04000 [Rhodothermales bacterium]|nr:hypothetical protein [Rhodothermales bacterium]
MKNLSQNSEFKLEREQIEKVKGGISRRVFSLVPYLKKSVKLNPRRENMKVAIDDSHEVITTDD